MTIRTDQKNNVTEQLRQMIGHKAPGARETDDAEASLTTLSFQSDIHPERHVWIDTDLEGIGLDLEDWNIEAEWDNAVARVKAQSLAEVVEITQLWLSGANLDDYYTGLNKEYKRIVKKDLLLEKSS